MPGPNDPHLIQFYFVLDGSAAPEDLQQDVMEVTIENSLHLPDSCTIHIYDNDFKWLNQDTFKPGTDIEVKSGYETTSENSAMDTSSVFHGEVTALEMDMNAGNHTSLTIHCLDQSHRLHRGRQSRSFKQMSDSDIVNQVAADAGLTVQADSSGTVHDWVLQNNQTNWEFLSERAKRAGFRLYVEGKNNLHFKAVANAADHTVELKWGESLLSFRPRLTAGHQVDKVQVRGWDRKQKQAIVSDLSSSPNGIPQVGTNNDGGAVASAAYSSASMILTDHPVFSQPEADKLARSIRDEIGGDFLEADGVCQGDPNLKPGVAVNITNIGDKYSGTYVLSSTTHTMSHGSDYQTHFTISGKRPSSLLSILSEDNVPRTKMGNNIVIGVVTQNKDDGDTGQGVGRVKVKFPWLGDNQESDWAQVAVPMAGSGRGFFFLPEIDDEVLVAFEHGDVRRPYIIGALWNGVDKPMEDNPTAIQDGKVIHRIIKTRIGHTLLFDDSTDNACIKMTTNYGHVLVLDDQNKKIEVKTTDGHTITLDDQNKKIVIVDETGSNKMTIDSTSNSIAMECAQNFSIKAQGQVSIEGQLGVEIKSPLTTTLEGTTQLSLKSDTMAELNGGITTNVKGGIVQIN